MSEQAEARSEASTDFETEDSQMSGNDDTDLPPDAVKHNRSGSMVRRRSSFGSGNIEVLDTMLRKYSHNHNSIDLTGGMGEQLLNDPQYMDGGDQDEQPALVNEFDEVADMQNEREQLGKLFEQIDMNSNGDVDIDEFVRGVQAIEVELNQVDIKKLFHLIDVDGSNFVDSDEFVMFCQRRAHNPEIHRLQSAIIDKANLADSRRGSNLLRPSEMGEWDESSMIHVQREMEQQMQQMLKTEVEVFQEHQNFFEEIEAREKEQEDFCSVSRAEDWDKFEVAAWVKNMGAGFDMYAKYFFQEEVDGQTLLNDISDGVLQYDLSVKIIHIPRILRNIDELRHQMKREMKTPFDFVKTVYEVTYQPPERMIDQVRDMEEELKAKEAEIEEMKRSHEVEVMHLMAQLERALQRRDEYITKGYNSESDDEEAGVERMKGGGGGHRELDDNVAVVDGPIAQPDLEHAISAVSDARSIMSGHSSAMSMSFSQAHLNALMQQPDPKANKSIKRLQHKLDVAKQENPEFAVPQRAREWIPQEVANWLNDMDFPEYGLAFMNSKVTGEILVSDITKDILTDDLGVRQVHSKVILRAIQRLKSEIPDTLTIAEFFSMSIDPEEERPSQEKIDALEARIEQLTNERDEIMKELESQQAGGGGGDDENENDEDAENGGGGFFSNKISELETERDELKSQLDEVTAMKEELESKQEESGGQVTELEEQLTEMKNEMDEKVERIRELEEDLEKRKNVDTVAPLKEHLSDILAECIQMADDDPDFADRANVVNWNSKEVLFWLHTIAFDGYIEAFADAAVDGQILVADITVDRLVNDLGVKGMHTAKFVREIQQLKDASSEEKLPDTLPDLKQIEKLEKELEDERKTKDNILREAEEFRRQMDQMSAVLHAREEGGGSADVDGEEGTNLDPETQERIAMLESKLEYITDDKMQTITSLGEEISSLRSIILALSRESMYWERAYSEAAKSPLEQVADMFLKPRRGESGGGSSGSGGRRRRYR